MNRVIANPTFGPNGFLWDILYQVTVIGLGVAATVAIYLEISGH